MKENLFWDGERIRNPEDWFGNIFVESTLPTFRTESKPEFLKKCMMGLGFLFFFRLVFLEVMPTILEVIWLGVVVMITPFIVLEYIKVLSVSSKSGRLPIWTCIGAGIVVLAILGWLV